MPPGIGCQSLKATRQSPLILNLERVIIRRSGVTDKIHNEKIRVRSNSNPSLYKSTTDGTNIRGRNRLPLTQRLFQCNIPLQYIWKLEIGINSAQRTSLQCTGRDRRCCCICRIERETLRQEKLAPKKRIAVRDLITDLLCSKIKEHPEPTT